MQQVWTTDRDGLRRLNYGGYSAKVLAHSVSPTGVELATFEVIFPRMVLAEFNTHRTFSRNSASSRAIPVSKQIRKMLENPFVPERFGINEPGMQNSAWLQGAEAEAAREMWIRGRNRAVGTALELLLGQEEAAAAVGFPYRFESITGNDVALDERIKASILAALDAFESYVKDCRRQGIEQTRFLNVHKQLANRVLEPFAWHTVIVTATDWDNFYALRDHADAQAEIKVPAQLMKEALGASTAKKLQYGQWHMPLIQVDEVEAAEADPQTWLRVSAGRSARVSYETHEGRRDIVKDVELYSRLVEGGHMSPTEHVATPIRRQLVERTKMNDKTGDVSRKESSVEEVYQGNLRGWLPLRKTLKHEEDYGKVLAAAIIAARAAAVPSY